MISGLNTLSTSEDPLVGAYARNLLLAANETTYCEPVFLPENSLKSSIRDKYRGVKPPEGLPKLQVYPNPAQGYFIVEYHLDREPKECHIEISDLTGQKIARIILQGKENQKIVPITHYPVGMYIVSLFANGNWVDAIKVTIIR
jgi:hypothetical protein